MMRPLPFQYWISGIEIFCCWVIIKMQLHNLAITIYTIKNTPVYPVYRTCHHHPEKPIEHYEHVLMSVGLHPEKLYPELHCHCPSSTVVHSQTGQTSVTEPFPQKGLCLRIPNQENTRKTVRASLSNCHLSHQEKLWCQQESKQHSDILEWMCRTFPP